MKDQYIIPLQNEVVLPEVEPKLNNNEYFTVHQDSTRKIQELRTYAIDGYNNQSRSDRARRRLYGLGVISEADLIDQESHAAGALFGAGGDAQHRFWHHQDDWFYQYSRPVSGGAEELTIHYQIESGGIRKIVHGYSVDFAGGEIETLLEVIRRYPSHVQHHVYDKLDI